MFIFELINNTIINIISNRGGISTLTTYTNGVKKVKKVKKVPASKEYEIAYVGFSIFSIKDMLK